MAAGNQVERFWAAAMPHYKHFAEERAMMETQAGEQAMTIRKSVHVKRNVDDAFRLFVDDMGKWWPLHTGHYTYGGDRAQDIYLEAHVGGRFFERFKDGDEFVVGHVIACERPSRIVFTWESPGWEAPTEIEVHFTPDGDATRVDLEHRGWERAGKEAAAMGASFGEGWEEVLGYYVKAA
jgi:uncharacterized protein YndB with AHSA1/START domain